MIRRLAVLATLVLGLPTVIAGQAVGVLHIKVVLMDKEQKATPVPRYALLISINPSSAPPRRVVTAADGTATVRLAPGNYTVESDQPTTFQGRAFQWTQFVDIVAGGDAVLELNAGNADADTGASASGNDSVFLLNRWQNTVVAIWTATTHASGFLIDGAGLIATTRASIGGATSVEVQLSREVKVAGRVLATDPPRDVAVVQIDPAIAASLRAVPLACAPEAQPPVTEGQSLHALEAPLGVEKSTTFGSVRRVDAHAMASDLLLGAGAAGGPVFSDDGALLGMTDEVDDGEGRRRGDARVVRIGDLCEAVVAAKAKMSQGTPPKGTHLPVEPAQPFPVAALAEAVSHRVGSLNPYLMEWSDFDVAFLTPLLIYGEHHPPSAQKVDRGSTRTPAAESSFVRPLVEFSNWTGYIEDYPPVLLIRATPKRVESFWTKVARGAAMTQGAALPPIKHFRSGFQRMRAYCGNTEIAPIHPFKLEQRISENDAIYEGLYVFDADALGPACNGVKLVLFSEKEPEKGDTRVVETKIIQQISRDFEPYRALTRAAAR